MKKLLLTIAFVLATVAVFSQTTQYKLNRRTGKWDLIIASSLVDSTFQSIDIDTLYFSKDSTYITGDGDTIKFVVDDGEALRLFDNAGTAQALFGAGSAAKPSISFISDNNSGFYLLSDNYIEIAIGGARKWVIYGGYLGNIENNRPCLFNEDASSTNPNLIPAADDGNTGVGHAGDDSLSAITGGVEAARFAEGSGKIWTTLIDTTIIEEGLVPDASQGADIGTDAYRFNLVWADTVHANVYTNSDIVLGESGTTATVSADSFKVDYLASSSTLLLSPTATGKIDTMETSDLGALDMTVTGDWIFDNITVDTITFENGATIHNGETDTLVLTETVVKVDGILEVTGTIKYEQDCGLTYISTAGIQTIAAGGTFEKLYEGAMAYTAGHLYNFTESNGRLTYTGTPTIHATINVSLSVESGETAQTIQFRIAENGGTIAGTNMTRDFTAVNRHDCIPLNWLIELATNDYIEVYGTSDTNGDTFNINNLTMTIIRH